MRSQLETSVPLYMTDLAARIVITSSTAAESRSRCVVCTAAAIAYRQVEVSVALQRLLVTAEAPLGPCASAYGLNSGHMEA